MARSIYQPAEDVCRCYTTLDGEQLGYLSDTGQLIGGLPAQNDGDLEKRKTYLDRATAVEDASLRSAEEATWNVQFHRDELDVTACGAFTNLGSVRRRQLY